VLKDAHTTADGALAAAIQAEQQFESEEAANQPEEPEFLTHFKSQGVWDLKTLPGAEDVILTRKFGNEQYVCRLARSAAQSHICLTADR
jgi:hypothetical protein